MKRLFAFGLTVLLGSVYLPTARAQSGFVNGNDSSSDSAYDPDDLPTPNKSIPSVHALGTTKLCFRRAYSAAHFNKVQNRTQFPTEIEFILRTYNGRSSSMYYEIKMKLREYTVIDNGTYNYTNYSNVWGASGACDPAGPNKSECYSYDKSELLVTGRPGHVTVEIPANKLLKMTAEPAAKPFQLDGNYDDNRSFWLFQAPCHTLEYIDPNAP